MSGATQKFYVQTYLLTITNSLHCLLNRPHKVIQNNLIDLIILQQNLVSWKVCIKSSPFQEISEQKLISICHGAPLNLADGSMAFTEGRNCSRTIEFHRGHHQHGGATAFRAIPGSRFRGINIAFLAMISGINIQIRESLMSRNATLKYTSRRRGAILKACFSLSDCDEPMAACSEAAIRGEVQWHSVKTSFSFLRRSRNKASTSYVY